MINARSRAGILLTGLFVAGCATSSGTHGKEAGPLKARVETLENQMASLSQRLDESAANPQAPQVEETAGSSAQSRPIGSAKTRPTVRQIQKALTSAGYYKGSVDGKEGPQTKKAIKAFQQAQGLKADGVVGSATTEALAEYLEE